MGTSFWHMPTRARLSLASFSALGILSVFAATASAGAVTIAVQDAYVTAPGKPSVVVVQVANGGRMTSGRLTLTVRAGRDATVRPASFGSARALRAKGSRTFRVRVGLRGDEPSSATFVIRSGRRSVARKTIAVAIGTGLEGRAFKQFRNTGVRVFVSSTITFVNGRYAYVGLPQEPPACRGPTDEEGGFGCKPYRYDSHSGAVAVGALKGRVGRTEAGTPQLTLGDETYGELYVPPDGTRLDVHVTASNTVGPCVGGSSACSSFQRFLTLRGDGTFQYVEQRWVEGTPGNPPPESGTYAITGGAIVFRYSDGTTLRRSFGAFIWSGTRPDLDWILLGGTLFIDL